MNKLQYIEKKPINLLFCFVFVAGRGQNVDMYSTHVRLFVELDSKWMDFKRHSLKDPASTHNSLFFQFLAFE